MFRFLLAIGVIVAIVIAVKSYSWKRMPRKSGALAKAMETRNRINKNSRDNQRKKDRMIHLSAEIFREMKIFPYSQGYVEEVNKMMTALDMRVNGKPMTVDHLFVKQCLLSFSSLGVAVMVVVAMSIAFGSFMSIGFLAVLSAPVLFKIPLLMLRSDFKEEQLSAMSQWLEFYNMYYSQYIQKENSVLLIDVVDNFLPLANPQLGKLLKRFRTDLDNGGDEYALDRLKNRYQDNVRVHKFVSVAKMRMTGDASSFDLMRSVQDELLAEEELAYEKDLKHKLQLSSTGVDTVLYISIALLFGVMIVSMVR